jgi:hypothetical protein
MNTCGQIIGYIALYFSCIRFLKKKKVELLYLSIFANAFYLMHYYMIGAYAGCITVVLAICRDYYIFLREKHHKKHRNRKLYNNAYIFVAIFITYSAFILLNINETKNILSLIAGLSYFCFEWFTTNKTTLKLASCVTTIPWLCYNIVYMSYPGIIADLLTLTSIFAGIFKDKKRR